MKRAMQIPFAALLFAIAPMAPAQNTPAPAPAIPVTPVPINPATPAPLPVPAPPATPQPSSPTAPPNPQATTPPTQQTTQVPPPAQTTQVPETTTPLDPATGLQNGVVAAPAGMAGGCNAFACLDSNDDDEISEEELSGATNDALRFADMDRDRNYRISLEEWDEFRSKLARGGR